MGSLLPWVAVEGTEDAGGDGHRGSGIGVRSSGFGLNRLETVESSLGVWATSRLLGDFTAASGEDWDT